MILNANIPLNTAHPTRRLTWRVGVFLGILLLGICIGWSTAKRLFVGITVPRFATDSGIAIRLTPENTLWIATHTQNLMLSEECPLNLATLITKKQPTWLVITDKSGEMHISLIGKNGREANNVNAAFSCETTQEQQKNAFFPLTLPTVWAWAHEATFPVALQENGLSITFPKDLTPAEQIPWPQKEGISALPITPQETPLPFSAQWQGAHDLLSRQKGVAFFSWQENGESAFATVIEGETTDEFITALLYDIGNVPLGEEKKMREDDISYTAQTHAVISLTPPEEERTAHINKGEEVGYIKTEQGYTLISTAPTEWASMTPYWSAELQRVPAEKKHAPKTLAHFGKKIFAKENTLTIFNK